LEGAGARVVPVDFEQEDDDLVKQLNQINGIYIPGDSEDLINDSHKNFRYTKAVQRILQWSQKHNEKEESHFPIMSVGYGFLAMMKS